MNRPPAPRYPHIRGHRAALSRRGGGRFEARSDNLSVASSTAGEKRGRLYDGQAVVSA
jgi:hypothetical protein